MDHLLKCYEIVKTDFIRGENCSLYDTSGRRYVDLESGIWCTVIGHNNKRINQIMAAQINQLIHLGTRYPNSLAEDAAVAVLKLLGFDDGKCIFLSSGSEAVEFGAQMARRVSGKPLLLTFSNSYLAAFGSAGRKNPQEWYLFDWSSCMTCDHIVACDPQCSQLREIPFEQIGGFVFEPGGSSPYFVHFPPKQIVRALVDMISGQEGWIVVNEITTGMGRTGQWFGYQHYELQPDIVAIGKGLGNGYPVSAVAISGDLALKIEASGFHYAQSHQNDPLGCAVAREVIASLQEGGLVERGRQIGVYFLQELQKLANAYELLKGARGRGMLLAVEFKPDGTSSVAKAYHELLERGYLVGYYPAGNILRFDPSLTIDKQDISHFIEAFQHFLESNRVEHG